MLEIRSHIPTVKINDPLFIDRKIEVYLRREDLNHPLVPGNKLRKLKYNLLEARSKGFETLLTFGGAFSNHILATAAAGKETGFQTIGVIRGELTEPLNPILSDSKAYGMQLHYMDRETYREKNSAKVVQALAREYGKFYLIPEGGSNHLALQGVREMIDWDPCTYTTICCPVGTGGTLAGIVSGGKSGETFLGFSSMKNNYSLENNVHRLLESSSEAGWSISHDYHFGGYAKAPAELLELIHDFEEKQGVPLDPVYTGKMVFGVADLISKNYFPKKSKILLIHTGGLQGKRGFLSSPK